MTPLEAADTALAADRDRDDPAIWITRLTDEAILSRARQLEAEGPRGRAFWGATFAVKDNIDIAGLPTTAGCPGYAYTATATAPAVERLLDAGALLIGKTNLDQFATGLVGTRSPYGVPRNVFNADYIPGGSSSGSAVAVAAGIVRLALGTDTAGSGRVPAAFGNIVGLKPTRGSVSTRGLVPACRSLDTVSIFAQSVDEALAVQRVIAGYDADDTYSRVAPFPYLRRGAAWPSARIATAETVDISLFREIGRLLYDGPWVAERTAALRDVVERRPDILHPVTRAILEGGLSRRTVDAFDAFHRLAEARRAVEHLFCEYDALLLPTAPFCPTLAEVAADPIGVNSQLGIYTNFVNLCDLAAIAVPAGFDSNGLPMGVTLIGPAWSEGRHAALADSIHRANVDRVGATRMTLPPPAAPDPLAADETSLFCIGAHMSGLPLNHQLTELGGRFLRATQTAPQYRLYALGKRPAMVRAADGAAIDGEVWALPTSSVGTLLAQVPTPLGFGTVQLTDGPCLGFLAEAAGIAGVRDITGHGGWRLWLASGEST
ncbi:MAG TPA: allophanate hydrolase [Acetobacteraceae bacterium]